MPFPFTVTVEVKTWLPVQFAPVEKTLKVIVPFGLPKPPDSVAVSAAEDALVPRVMDEGETRVVIEGLAG